jgi:hypothetical protein
LGALSLSKGTVKDGCTDSTVTVLLQKVTIMATADTKLKIYVSNGPREFGFHIEGFIQGREQTFTFGAHGLGRVVVGVKIQSMEAINRLSHTWRAKCQMTSTMRLNEPHSECLAILLQRMFDAGPVTIIYSTTGAGHIEK